MDIAVQGPSARRPVGEPRGQVLVQAGEERRVAGTEAGQRLLGEDRTGMLDLCNEGGQLVGVGIAEASTSSRTES